MLLNKKLLLMTFGTTLVYCNAGGKTHAEKRTICPVSMTKDLPVINKEIIPFPFTLKVLYKILKT
jgi:hypothetical protein